MRASLLFSFALSGLLVLFPATSASAAEGAEKKAATKDAAVSAEPSPELKKDLADMYQKMAECLRTEKSLHQCSRDAMQSCPVMEKTGHCPINEGTGAMMHKRKGMGSMKGMDMGSPNGGAPAGGP